MPIQRFPLQAGVFLDDSPLASETYFQSADKMRFVRGFIQTIGGYEKASNNTLEGKGRASIAWATNHNDAFSSFGTHLFLYAMDVDGDTFNITPIGERGELTNAISSTDESALFKITDSSHGLVVGQLVKITGASSVGGVTLSGSYSVTEVVDTNNYKITASSAATSTVNNSGGTFDYEYGIAMPGAGQNALQGLGYGTGGYGSGGFASPATEQDLFLSGWTLAKWGQNLIAAPREGSLYEWYPETTYTEKVTNGDFSTIGSYWTRGTGWTAQSSTMYASAASSDLTQNITLDNGAYALLDFDVNTVVTGTLRAYWGSTTIVSTGIKGTFKTEFYTGSGGTQSLKLEGTSLTAEIDNVSVKMMSNASMVSAAPSKIGSVFVTPERIAVCCGSTDPSTSEYNPMRVAWSDTEILSSWTPSTTNLAGNKILQGNSTRIVRGIPTKGENVLFTDNSLISMRYTGNVNNVFSFDLINTNTGLIGPQAVCEGGNGALFWMSPSINFYSYSNGSVTPIPCTVIRDIKDNLNFTQREKIHAFHCAEYNEVFWYYPDWIRDNSQEVSRYVILNYITGVWSIGHWDLSTAIQSGIYPYPLALNDDGEILFIEKGFSDNGGKRQWNCESSWFNVGDGVDTQVSLKGFFPDADNDIKGGYNVTITSRNRNSSGRQERTYGPFEINATTGKVSVRVDASEVKVKWEGDDAPSFYRMGVPAFDIEATARKR
tara:strand:- start:491 stop:2644 length:2154 start_codon:yes stop_codon:yes gene_type:complete